MMTGIYDFADVWIQGSIFLLAGADLGHGLPENRFIKYKNYIVMYAPKHTY
jgi:hypothetical protein